MNLDSDFLQQPLLLQGLAAAQDGMANNRVVGLKELCIERLPDIFLREVVKIGEGPVAKKASILDAQLQTQRSEVRVFFAGRQGIA